MEEKGKEYCYYVAADPHYLSPLLFDRGKAFERFVQFDDGKLTEYGDEIINALIRQTIEARPDGLIITGDLTLNGEKQSLIDFTEKLRKLQDAGIPVYTISGNHDFDHPRARSYIGDNAQPAEKAGYDDFLRYTGIFGRQNALKDEKTCSYLAKLQENMYLLALDANSPGSDETIPGPTLKWADEVLSALPEGSAVIGLTHQNLLKQNPFMNREIRNNGEVKELYRKYGIRLNLSGHAHLQHTSREDGLTDICTESLMIQPLQYGILRFRPDSYEFTYTSRELGILREESAERLYRTVMRMTAPNLSKADIPPQMKEEMIGTAYRISAVLFAGKALNPETIRNEPGWEGWREYAADSFWYRFLKNAVE